MREYVWGDSGSTGRTYVIIIRVYDMHHVRMWESREVKATFFREKERDGGAFMFYCFFVHKSEKNEDVRFGAFLIGSSHNFLFPFVHVW